MAIYEMGPGAASIEYIIIKWCCQWWAAAGAAAAARRACRQGLRGVLTHGGSLANLTA
jgi:L-2,4-diaminobutyrate decarboxylase